MARFLRVLVGLTLLPACWGTSRAAVDALKASAVHAGGVNVEVVSFLLGIVAFVMCWIFLSPPVKTYVLGHELTHALWGMLFGARPSNLHVSEKGGSVNLTKSNLVITLAPYFFPFWTFVVLSVALVTSLIMKRLPCWPVWLFMIGLTWAFHIVFTIDTLAERQPDVALYGRLFSWSVVFLANLALMLLALVAATPLRFSELGGFLASRILSAYSATGIATVTACRWMFAKCSQT